MFARVLAIAVLTLGIVSAAKRPIVRPAFGDFFLQVANRDVAELFV